MATLHILICAAAIKVTVRGIIPIEDRNLS